MKEIDDRPRKVSGWSPLWRVSRNNARNAPPPDVLHLELEPGFPIVLVLLQFGVHDFSFGHSISLESFPDQSGDLTVCEPLTSAGIEVKRVYFLHNLAEGSRRGGHAHRALHQLLIAVSGSFDLRLTHEGNEKVIHAKSASQAFYVPPMTWRELYNFSPDAICLVLASEFFSEDDYIRERELFDQISASKLR